MARPPTIHQRGTTSDHTFLRILRPTHVGGRMANRSVHPAEFTLLDAWANRLNAPSAEDTVTPSNNAALPNLESNQQAACRAAPVEPVGSIRTPLARRA